MTELHKIELQKASYGFDGQNVFESLNIQLPEFEVVSVYGGMGLGKSVLLKLFSGLLLPREGSFLINDLAVNQMSFEEFLPWRRKIGYGFDAGGLLNNRSLYENLALPLEYHKIMSPEEIRSRILATLERFELIRVKDKRPASVSASQRKAAAVARALVLEPQMLILDDPFTNLDIVAKRQLLTWIKDRMQSRALKFALISSSEEFSISSLSIQHLEVLPQAVRWAQKVAA